MKLSSILGTVFFMAAAISTAQAKEVAISGADFHALTSATQACLQYNEDGWVFYNYSAGTCAGPQMTVVASVPHINDSSLTGDMVCFLDGSCPSGNNTVTCTLKTIGWSGGTTVGTPMSQTSSPGSSFDIALTQPRSDMGDYNYSVIVCNLSPGCRIWGSGCNF